jgi:hypothetical protein
MTIPKEVREAMARAYADKAYQGGWDGHDAEEKAIVLQHFDAALSALGEAGYALAKIEPTQAMVNAARATQYDDKSYSVLRVWDAMLEASLEQK